MSRPVSRPTGPRQGTRRERRVTWLIGVSSALVAMAGISVVVVHHQLTADVPKPLSFSDAPALTADPPSAGAPAAAVPAPGAAKAAKAATTTVVTPPPTTAPPAPASRVATTTAKAAPTAAAPAAATSPVEGTWTLVSSSVAGFRIGYTSPVGDGTRVGRTNAVTGQMGVHGSTVQTGRFSVDFRQIECDGGSTCTQHIQQIMDVADFPYETFVLTSPIRLGSVPPDGKQVSTPVTGQLTLRGVTQAVTFTLTARRNSARIDVLGSIPVDRDDYKIPDANEPGFHIAKKGTVELLLTFQHS
jgi:polyisoprenoid-binding protein YceI